MFIVELNWSKKQKESFLTRQFNVSALLKYFTYFDFINEANFMNLQGIELNLFDKPLAH